jgi:demethylmenaquinone methyltransferase / 2-methoxy-6-polyprenyl-1,4-benzoquinol methylase
MPYLAAAMSRIVTPYGDPTRTKKQQVGEMFDHIAPTYDFLNHFLSLGIDRGWRKRAIQSLAIAQPKLILDIATGTGDFAVEALSLSPTHVTAMDISEGMMDVGRAKTTKKMLQDKISFVHGDSEAMPFEDNKFDAITVGFGVRNFEHLEIGLRDMYRVIRTGGRVAILEVGKPSNGLVKMFFNMYFNHILPNIGKLFSSDVRAYTYLPESVSVFPHGEDLVKILQATGFTQVQYQPLTFGICALYTCQK